jgi:hypothetical protein
MKRRIPEELEGIFIPSETEWYFRSHGYSRNEAKKRVALLRQLGLMAEIRRQTEKRKELNRKMAAGCV